jgi:hypothetical protein
MTKNRIISESEFKETILPFNQGKKEQENKIASEAEMRKGILALAKRLNFEGDVRAIFARYDNLLRGCTNQQERKAISIMGIAELHRLLHCQGELVINGEEIIPAASDFVEKE